MREWWGGPKTALLHTVATCHMGQFKWKWIRMEWNWKHSSSALLCAFQVLIATLLWLVATVFNRVDRESFHHHGKFYKRYSFTVRIQYCLLFILSGKPVPWEAGWDEKSEGSLRMGKAPVSRHFPGAQSISALWLECNFPPGCVFIRLLTIWINVVLQWCTISNRTYILLFRFLIYKGASCPFT